MTSREESRIRRAAFREDTCCLTSSCQREGVTALEGIVIDLRNRVMEQEKQLSRGETQVRQLWEAMHSQASMTINTEEPSPIHFPERDDLTMKECQRLAAIVAEQQKKMAWSLTCLRSQPLQMMLLIE